MQNLDMFNPARAAQFETEMLRIKLEPKYEGHYQDAQVPFWMELCKLFTESSIALSVYFWHMNYGFLSRDDVARDPKGVKEYGLRIIDMLTRGERTPEHEAFIQHEIEHVSTLGPLSQVDSALEETRQRLRFIEAVYALPEALSTRLHQLLGQALLIIETKQAAGQTLTEEDWVNYEAILAVLYQEFRLAFTSDSEPTIDAQLTV